MNRLHVSAVSGPNTSKPICCCPLRRHAPFVLFVGPILAMAAFGQDVDLSLSISAPTTITAGETLRYDISVLNSSPDDATNVVIEIRLPAEVEIVEWSGDAAFVAGTPGDPQDPTVIIRDVVPADTILAFFNIFVLVSPDTPINQALPCGPNCIGRILCDGEVRSLDNPDPDQSNNLDSLSTDVEFEADLQVFLNDTPDTVNAGDQLTYEAIVNNAGPSTSRDVVLIVDLPDEVAFESLAIAKLLRENIEDFIVTANNQVILNLGDVPVGTPPLGQLNVLMNTRVLPDTPEGIINASARAFTYVTADPNAANDEADEDTNVVACELPAAPVNVNATDGVHIHSVIVRWDEAPGATAYNVYRNTVDTFGTAELLATVPELVYVDLKPATPGAPGPFGCENHDMVIFYYWVTAVDACGESPPSDLDTGYENRAKSAGVTPTRDELSGFGVPMFLITVAWLYTRRRRAKHAHSLR